MSTNDSKSNSIERVIKMVSQPRDKDYEPPTYTALYRGTFHYNHSLPTATTLTMPKIICRSICPSGHPFGTVCGQKAARKSGCVCKPCYLHAKKLLLAGNLTPSQSARVTHMLLVNKKNWMFPLFIHSLV